MKKVYRFLNLYPFKIISDIDNVCLYNQKYMDKFHLIHLNEMEIAKCMLKIFKYPAAKTLFNEYYETY